MANRLIETGAAIWSKWWVKVLAIWTAGRAVSTAGFFWADTQQLPTIWWPKGHPNMLSFIGTWDVEWYRRVYEFGVGQLPGYPLHLPVNQFGAVIQNAWAFMPGYPMLVRLITTIAGRQAKWEIVAPLTSLVLSYLFALMLCRVLRIKLDDRTTLWSVTLFAFWCATPVLQIGYAESLALLLLAGGLYYLMQHRYWASLPWLVGLSITRPGMVAFAAMLAGMWLVRWFKDRHGVEEFPALERYKLAGLTLVSGVLGLIWPLFAWWVTGRQDAYTVTELAWREIVPRARLIPFQGWWELGAALWGPPWAAVFVALVMLVAAWLLFTEPMRKLGNELRLWTGSYLLYLFLFFHAQSSTFRIMMPAFPLLAGFAFFSRNWPRWVKWLIILAMIAAEIVWFKICWVFLHPDFTPP